MPRKAHTQPEDLNRPRRAPVDGASLVSALSERLRDISHTLGVAYADCATPQPAIDAIEAAKLKLLEARAAALTQGA